jgi:hypothetical protein
MLSFQHYKRCAAVIYLSLAGGAYAQVSSINSAIIQTHVFNDIPTATPSFINNYPSSITLSESGVANHSNTNAFADRDIWRFSNNGSTAYQFLAGDYFSASMSVTLTGGTPNKGLEMGWLFSNPSGTWGGDLQSLVTKSGVVVQFGGPSYYPFSPAAGGYPGAGGSVPNYTNGQTYTMGLIYTIDPNNGRNAFEYSVNGQYAASAPGDPYFDLGVGVSIGSPGDTLGGYFQIQNDSVNTNSGTAVFGNISITGLTVPEPAPVAYLLLGLGALPLAGLLRRRRV